MPLNLPPCPGQPQTEKYPQCQGGEMLTERQLGDARRLTSGKIQIGNLDGRGSLGLHSGTSSRHQDSQAMRSRWIFTVKGTVQGIGHSSEEAESPQETRERHQDQREQDAAPKLIRRTGEEGGITRA